MAKKPYTQIQKSAPGPPHTMAVATPAMLPVPMDAPSAVMNAWKELSAPAPSTRTGIIALNASPRRTT